MTARSRWIVPRAMVGVVLGMLASMSPVVRAAPPAIDEAQVLTEEGKFKEAREKLDGFSPETRGEKALQSFALGYLAQRQADATTGEAATAHLIEARDAYLEALALYPYHAATHGNLALVLERLGQPDEAVESWKVVLEARPERAHEYALHLGDLLAQLGRTEEALDSFRRAVVADPNDRTARYRMLTSLARQERSHDLFEMARELGREAPEVSLEAIETALASPKFRRGPEGVPACVQWASLASAVGLSGARVGRLPSVEEFPHACNVQLQQMIGGPPALLSLDALSWWNVDWRPELQHIAASVLLERGRQTRIDPEQQHDAMRLLELAQDIAPDVRVYQEGQLQDERWIYLDVALEVAGLYNELDQEVGVPERFEGLERELFHMKGQAIRDRDWEGMQRLHSTLGLIYVERGRWWDDGRFDNASFQLERALAAARKRAEESNNDPEPLPHIKESLATVYDMTGRLEAPKLRVSASRDYLNLDDLESCRRVLGQVHHVPESLATEHRLLNEILETREAVGNVQPGQIDALWHAVEKWGAGPNDAFLNRQRFKALADLGAAAEKVGELQKAVSLHYAALESRPDSAGALSLGDVYRLREMEHAFRQSVDFGADRSLIQFHTRPGADAEPALSWRVHAWSMDKASVTASKDLLIGAWIATMAPQTVSKILVEHGRVTLQAGDEDPGDTRRLVQQLKGVEGVRDVQVKPTKRPRRPK